MRNASLILGISSALYQAQMDQNGAEGTDVQVTANDIQALADTAEEPETEASKEARRARLQAHEASAQAASNDGTALPERVVTRAREEILICWQEFAGEGGVYDLQKQAQKKLRNISQHILAIARECAAAAYERTHGDPRLDFGKLASAMFRNAIAMAELYLRGTLDLAAPEAEEKLDTFLAGSWRNYCSQVRSAVEANFDPRDHETIYSLRQAVQAAKEATSTGTRDDSAANAGTTTETSGDATQGTPAPNTGAAVPGSEQDEAADEDRNGLDWSELEAIAQGSASIQSALILLHQAIHGTKLDEGNAEERVTNILNVAVREITKLARREELADDGSDGMATDQDDETEIDSEEHNTGQTLADLHEMEAQEA